MLQLSEAVGVPKTERLVKSVSQFTVLLAGHVTTGANLSCNITLSIHTLVFAEASVTNNATAIGLFKGSVAQQKDCVFWKLNDPPHPNVILAIFNVTG